MYVRVPHNAGVLGMHGSIVEHRIKCIGQRFTVQYKRPAARRKQHSVMKFHFAWDFFAQNCIIQAEPRGKSVGDSNLPDTFLQSGAQVLAP
jgi:hypothetical protein